MENLSIKKASSIVGSQAKLAKACGKTQTSVWKWANNKSDVSPEIVPLIVAATNGMVKAHEIRPDLPMLFPHE